MGKNRLEVKRFFVSGLFEATCRDAHLEPYSIRLLVIRTLSLHTFKFLNIPDQSKIISTYFMVVQSGYPLLEFYNFKNGSFNHTEILPGSRKGTFIDFHFFGHF